jgi:hypothetical protein
MVLSKELNYYNMNAFMRIGSKLCTPFLMLFQKSVRQGAYSSVYAATSLDLEKINGKYIFHCRNEHMNKIVNDIKLCKDLWKISEDVTNLKQIILNNNSIHNNDNNNDGEDNE